MYPGEGPVDCVTDYDLNSVLLAYLRLGVKLTDSLILKLASNFDLFGDRGGSKTLVA